MSKHKQIISPEQFAQMSSKAVCELMQKNPAYAIVGYAKGVDRRIIQRNPNEY